MNTLRHVLILVALTFIGVGCGDSSTVVSTPECDEASCPEAADTNSDAVNDISDDTEQESDTDGAEITDGDINEDSGEAQADAEEDDTLETDASSETALDGTESEDTGEPEDADLEGPVVESISPAAGESDVAVPFIVEINFNEPLRPETVDKNNFQLIAMSGKNIGGTPELSEDGKTVVLTPLEAKQDWTSTYKVEISAFVQDVLGNLMEEDYRSEFYTGVPGNMTAYEALVEQYAPIVQQDLSSLNTHYDYPTRVDLDDDWEVKNNRGALKKASEVTPAFYWDVAESRSHLFLYYFYYYPLKLSDEKKSVSNEMAAFIVTLAKGEEFALSPVSVAAYASPDVSAGIEKVDVYQVEGSDLGKGNQITRTAPWSELATEDHFLGRITQGLHVTCSSVFSGDGECEFNEGTLLTQEMVTFTANGEEVVPLAKDGTWPMDGEWTMEMHHLLPALWARRGSIGEGGLWQDSYEFDYEAKTDQVTNKKRPGDDLTDLPSFFDPVDEDHKPGRPPWSWKWAPGASFTDLPQGTLYLDPAFFFSKRHGMEQFQWSPEDKTGWSVEYCYHGALGIDERESLDDCLPLD